MNYSEFKELLNTRYNINTIIKIYQEGAFYSKIYNSHGIYLELGITKQVWAKKLIELYEREVIIEYDQNRGLKGIDSAHVDKMYKEFDIMKLNNLTVSAFPFDMLMMCDFHHRIQVVKKYFKNNPEAEDFLIDVKYVPIEKALDVYQGLNNQKGHTTKNNLTNRDYAIGSVLADCIEEYNCNMNHSTHLAYLCIAYGKYNKNVVYPNVYAMRIKVKSISDVIGGRDKFFELTNINQKKLDEIIEAVKLYHKFILCLDNRFKSKKEQTIEFKKLNANVAFFSYFTTDCLREDSLFLSKPIDTIARQLFPNLSLIVDYLSRLIGVSAKTVELNCGKLDEIIRETLDKN